MISSHNEWDTLHEVVVGSATGANWPSTDPVFAQESGRTTWRESPVPSGAVPQWIQDEANQDLDALVSELVRRGVVVRRPQARDFSATGGMYNYCPRDRLLIAGNTIVDCAMMYPCRDQEIECLDRIVQQTGRVLRMPRDQGMILDAANICRLGDTWLFLESASGNRAAYEWLCVQFPHINIELCNFYAGVHIDSTIVPIHEGLVLLNASRVNPDNCPRVFRKWQKIWVHDVVPQDFYQYPYASKWIGMNLLMLDPETAIVDAAQTRLHDQLDLNGITVIPMTLRHSRTLGGGFHCVTLDIKRQ
jgi:scyllo-inosamine-4-phosphate amidinotransferase 1